MLDNLALYFCAGLPILFWFTWRWFFRLNPAKYWKQRNVPFVDLESLGLDKFAQDSAFSRYEVEKAKYREFKKVAPGGFVGVYENSAPALYVYGLDILEHIFVQDFMSCVNRRLSSAELSDPVGRKSLFHAQNRDWKELRASVNPLFTTATIRQMSSTLISNSAQKLIKLIKAQLPSDSPVELRSLLQKFTTEATVGLIFGKESGAFESPPTGFHTYAGKVHPQFNRFQVWKWRLVMKYPLLRYILNVPAYNSAALDFFRKEIVEFKENLKLEETPKWKTLIGRFAEIEEQRGANLKATAPDHQVGTTLSFFIAGINNMLEAFACAIYELAMNPGIQERVYQEILSIQNNSVEGVDGILNSEYYEKFWSELFRKYCVLLLERRTNEEVKLPNTNAVIPKNTQILVPIHAMQNDEDIYPNPGVLDPERFSEENKKARHLCGYLPFGIGPRNCIAYKFARAEAKIAVAHLVLNFKFKGTKDMSPVYNLGSPLSVLVEARDTINLTFDSSK